VANEDLRDWWEELFQVHEYQQFQSYAQELTAREVDFIVEALSLTGVQSLLDVACGGGRHALELARRKYQVEGIDAARPVISHANAEAQAEELPARFHVGDMRQLKYDARFDAVLLMNSSLGFFDDIANRKVLEGILRALVPGGKLLLQMLNPYQIPSFLSSFRTGWYQLGQGYVLREARFDPRTARLLIDYRYVDPQQNLDLSHPGDSIRLYGFPELQQLLTSVGFMPRSVFGDAILPPVTFDESSQWQVIVAEKPRSLDLNGQD
jgi:SAM-dependent methyltransferase